MDRDGHQGWSRRAEAGYDRVFGHRTPPPSVSPLYLTPGEIVSDGHAQWRVNDDYLLEEIPDGIPTEETGSR